MIEHTASTEEMKFRFATRESVILPRFDKPLFIVAYWPPGKWWKMHGMFSDSELDAMSREIERLQMKGWAHIQIMRLPEQAPT